MYIERLIASRLTGSVHGKSFSNVIIKIAIASIAISVAVMIVASAMITGFKKEISQKIFDFWGHVQITEAYTNPIFEGSPMKYDPLLVDSLRNIHGITYEWPLYILGWDTNKYIEKTTIGGVKTVFRYIQYPAVLTTREDMEGLLLKGVADEFPTDFFDRYIVAGRPISLTGTDDEAEELLISESTANRLILEPGDAVIVYFVREGRPKPRRYEVAGIYKTGLAEYDKKVAFVALSHLQKVLEWDSDEISGMEVVLDDVDDLDIMNDYINQEVLPSHLYTRSVRKVAANIFDWLDLQDNNEVLILGLMLLVCIINMITALLILILERTQMIGLLKALGSTNWQIRKIFIRQAAYILGIGLLLGNALGLFICYMQKHYQFIKLSEDDYYLAVAPIHVDLSAILLINSGTLLITVLFLILPSYFISRISPTKALRFN